MGYRDTKETLNAYQKKFREDNRGQIRQWAKEFYERNKERESIRHSKYVNTPRGRYSVLKTAVKHYNRHLDITLDQYKELIKPNKCHYCNGPLAVSGHSLDRVDNSKDYLYTNVVACCKKCNAIKSNILSYEEMIEVGKVLGLMWGSYDISI